MTIQGADAQTRSSQSDHTIEDFESSLSTSGSTINTGRYVITAARDFTRDHSSQGEQGHDGGVNIFDTETGTYVDVWGDLHITTGDRDRAKFGSKAFNLFLADGTNVEFLPTSVENGASFVDSVVVSKNGQNVRVNDVHSGQLSVSRIEEGSVPDLGHLYGTQNVVRMFANSSLNDLTFSDDLTQLKCQQTELDLDSRVPAWLDFSTKLSTSDNTIDTGRYLVTASRDYIRDQSYRGGTASDGEVKVYDKRTNTYLDVFGDPHITDSAGDKAKFGSSPLKLLLEDGTQIEFMPTALRNGVTNIDSVSVTKCGQTSFITGVSGGTLNVSQAVDGKASDLNSQYGTEPAIYLTSQGSLSSLYVTSGPQLDKGRSEVDLDAGMRTGTEISIGNGADLDSYQGIAAVLLQNLMDNELLNQAFNT